MAKKGFFKAAQSARAYFKTKERARALANRISVQIERGTGKGLKAVLPFIIARIKETLSVPAPRKRVVSNAGEIYYRATTPAVQGAPPRKLSGRMRSSVNVGPNKAVIGVPARGRPTKKHPRGFPYPRYHEVKGMGSGSGRHRYIAPTLKKWAKAIKKILGGALKTTVR